jgi:hypothetical protein
MWEFLLREKGQLGADDGPFRLGGLLEVEIPFRPPEQAWLEAPADLVDDDDQIELDDESGDVLKLFDDTSETL